MDLEEEEIREYVFHLCMDVLSTMPHVRYRDLKSRAHPRITQREILSAAAKLVVSGRLEQYEDCWKLPGS